MVNRLIKLMQSLKESNRAYIVTSKVNRFYLLGFSSSVGTLIITKDCAYFIVDFRYIEKAQAMVNSDACKVILEKSIYTQITEILLRHQITDIDIEAQLISLSKYLELKQNLQNFTINTDNKFNNTLNQMRSVKTPQELEFIKHAQQIADQGFLEILNYIKPGMTELQVSVELEIILRRLGADSLSFPIICASGSNGSMPHAVPSSRAIQVGDFVTLDFGVVVDGYCSDMTRTIGIGKISDSQLEIYQTVLEAQKLAINSIKSGVYCKQIDLIAREYICSCGYGDYFGHGLGHSIGMDVHESPFFNQKSPDILLENVVMTVEPGIYIPKKYGVRIEDMVSITQSGCVTITNSEKNIIIL